MGIHLLRAGPWYVQCGLELRLLTSKVSLHFWSTIHERGALCSTTATAPPLHHTVSLHLSTCLFNSTPPTRLDEYGFFKSLVVRLPFSSIFWRSWVLSLLRSSYNSFCGCQGRQIVSTYTSILTGSPLNCFTLMFVEYLYKNIKWMTTHLYPLILFFLIRFQITQTLIWLLGFFWNLVIMTNISHKIFTL